MIFLLILSFILQLTIKQPQKPRLSHQEKRGFVHNILFYNAIPKHYIYTLYVLKQILLLHSCYLVTLNNLPLTASNTTVMVFLSFVANTTVYCGVPLSV